MKIFSIRFNPINFTFIKVAMNIPVVLPSSPTKICGKSVGHELITDIQKPHKQTNKQRLLENQPIPLA